MRYLVVNDHVVTNIVLADEALQDNWLLSDIGDIGWYCNLITGEITEPQPPEPFVIVEE